MAIDVWMEDGRRPSFPDRHQLLPLIASEPVQRAVADRPDRAVAVFDEVGDRAERPARLTGGDLSVAEPPNAAAVGEPDPQAAVAGDAQRGHGGFREGGVAQDVPMGETQPVEAEQPGVCADPEVAIGVLANRVHGSQRYAVAVGPGGERIAGQRLIDRGRPDRS